MSTSTLILHTYLHSKLFISFLHICSEFSLNLLLVNTTWGYKLFLSCVFVYTISTQTTMGFMCVIIVNPNQCINGFITSKIGSTFWGCLSFTNFFNLSTLITSGNLYISFKSNNDFTKEKVTDFEFKKKQITKTPSIFTNGKKTSWIFCCFFIDFVVSTRSQF